MECGAALVAIFRVPPEPPDQQCWQAAVGYAELGMFVEADSELDKIDPVLSYSLEVLALRRHLSWIEKMGVDAATR